MPDPVSASRLRRFVPFFLVAALLACSLAPLASAADAAPPPPKAEPSLEQRVADLEAYIANSPRGSDATDAKITSKISGSGPGHNAWMMTAAALVLFMTLPGLALFYGGLVRSKNILSVMAQCLGIAGLVAILWWAVGYSLTFSSGTAVAAHIAATQLRDKLAAIAARL